MDVTTEVKQKLDFLRKSYVLDDWFIQTFQSRLKAVSKLIRFADDFLLLFASQQRRCRSSDESTAKAMG